jgi:hypothetical protein
MGMETFTGGQLLTPVIQRESGGNPWVLSALLDRELAVDAIVQANQQYGYLDIPAELWDTYHEKLVTADLRKQLAGIEEPFGQPS